MKADEEIKRVILSHLRKHKESSIGNIVNDVGYSRPTVSKYLRILEAEKRVKRRETLPYVYYSLIIGRET